MRMTLFRFLFSLILRKGKKRPLFEAERAIFELSADMGEEYRRRLLAVVRRHWPLLAAALLSVLDVWIRVIWAASAPRSGVMIGMGIVAFWVLLAPWRWKPQYPQLAGHIVVAGLLLVTMGALLNGIVMVTNAGRMPVAGLAVEMPEHTPVTDDTNFAWLGDVFTVYRQHDGLPLMAFSIGDTGVVMGVGCAVAGSLMVAVHRRHRRG